MSVAIAVRDVSKRYRIGVAEERSETFAGQIMDMVKAPLRNLRHLRSLSRFKDEDESVFWALRDISFDVQEGEVLGIIGHNGAGKSTLLKILSRITEPTTGEVRIKGRVSSLLEVGTGFHPDLTGRENIYMNGTILGMRKKEIDRKLDEIIAFSGVAKYIDTPVKRYSSGMKVRLAFSVAAHLEPEVLIIDEVLAVGDAEFQAKCLGKMKDVAGQGRTVLFVSHNMAAVQNLCTRSILIKSGEVDTIGNVDEVIRQYLLQVREHTFDGTISDKVKRPWGWDGARFTFIRLLDENGDELKNFFYKQQIQIYLEVEAFSTINLAYVVIIITNTEGNRIASTNSYEFGELQLLSLNKGTVKMNVAIESNFVPDKYFISLRLINFSNNKVIDAIDEIVEFNILSVVGKGRSAFPFKRGSAPIFNKSYWTLLENSEFSRTY